MSNPLSYHGKLGRMHATTRFILFRARRILCRIPAQVRSAVAYDFFAEAPSFMSSATVIACLQRMFPPSRGRSYSVVAVTALSSMQIRLRASLKLFPSDRP